MRKTKQIRLRSKDVYYYAHNEIQWLTDLFNLPPNYFPYINILRLNMAWRAMFLLDDSGRSTAKTHNHMMLACAKNTLFNDRLTTLFAKDERKGMEILRLNVNPLINKDAPFRNHLQPPHNAHEPRIIGTGSMARLLWRGHSELLTYTPNIKQGADSTRSSRTNCLIFNEWTFWPEDSIDKIEEVIVPIASRTNLYHADTVEFRKAMEIATGEHLGRFTNEHLIAMTKGKPNYKPREHLLGTTPIKSSEELVECFYANFQRYFLFDYREGIEDPRMKSSPIKGKDDIIEFFEDYLSGDPVYANQIIYDSSAQRPSAPHYEFVEHFWGKVDKSHPAYRVLFKETLNGEYMDKHLSHGKLTNPSYMWFNCHSDDIPEKYDGIIYNSPVIAMYREKALDEDFQRVYGGRWTEGQDHRPFDPAAIRACRQNPEIGIAHGRDTSKEEMWIMAVDPAQGTESLTKGEDQKNVRGKGDDAGGAIGTVGKGTKEDPHYIGLIYKADNVMKHPMARDIHELDDRFLFDCIPIDPGGGGKELVETLGKQQLEIDGEFIPVVPKKLIDAVDADQVAVCRQNLMFISRSTKDLAEFYKQSKHLSSFQDDGHFKSYMINKAMTIIESGGVVFPYFYTDRELIVMVKNREITVGDAHAYAQLNEALQQLFRTNYKTDKNGKKVRTKAGYFDYTYPKRKDLMMVIVYFLFIADWIVEMKKLTENAKTDEIPVFFG